MLTNTNKISIAIQILRQIQANWSLFLKKSGDLGGSCWPPFLVAAFALPICARNMAKDSKAAIFLCLCCICVGSLRRCQGIWLNLPATGTKCVSEDIQANVVVLADYIVVSEDHPQPPTISVKVILFRFCGMWDFIIIFFLFLFPSPASSNSSPPPPLKAKAVGSFFFFWINSFKFDWLVLFCQLWGRNLCGGVWKFCASRVEATQLRQFEKCVLMSK